MERYQAAVAPNDIAGAELHDFAAAGLDQAAALRSSQLDSWGGVVWDCGHSQGHVADSRRHTGHVSPRRPMVTADRFTAQLLCGSAATEPEAVVDRLLAVQAQDERGFRLAIRARTTGVNADDVDAALTERRTMVLTWLNRGTLHLVRAEDYWWLHTLTTPQLEAGLRRRLGQENVTAKQAERAVEVIAEKTRQAGPRTRAELRAALDDAGVPTRGQALYLLLYAASQRAVVVRGPIRDGEHCYAATESWLGQPPAALNRVEALTLLARRYLRGHGPANARDLATWAGIGLKDARSGLSGLDREIVERPAGLLEADHRPVSAPVPGPRLLGPFDPLLHGWVSRQFVLGTHQGIVTTNGLFRPFALVDGRAVATWGLGGGRITIRPLEQIAPHILDELLADSREVLRFLGKPPTEPVVAT